MAGSCHAGLIAPLLESRAWTGHRVEIAAYALRTLRSASLRQRLLAASALTYAAVFLLLVEYGRPGLGISQGFYLAIVLAALATDAATGAVAGATAVVLYVAAELMAGRTNWEFLLSTAVSIRLVAYVVAGVAAGWFARRARILLGESLSIIDGLLELGQQATEQLDRTQRRAH